MSLLISVIDGDSDVDQKDKNSGWVLFLCDGGHYKEKIFNKW